jgi:glyceraldehyde 3-phosphate dehydrogenase
MTITIGLMGFGRIGRNIFRIVHDREDIRVGAISDVADPEALTYLLRYDTILGRFPDLVSYLPEPGREDLGYLYTVGKEVPVLTGTEWQNPGQVDWRPYGVDYVVEATGRDRPVSVYRKHIEQGARRVVLCVPPSDHPDRSIVYGVNHDQLTPKDEIISNASCTAHAAAPVLKILHGAFGIEEAHFTAVHAFSSVQRLADVPASELRLSRAAAQNIVPADTNAARVLDEVLPELKGRISASALRVPVPNGSVVDMTIQFARDVSIDRINEVVRTAAAGPYRDIVEYAEDPIVSTDVTRSTHSATFDALATMVLGARHAKAIVWFDNSWAYSHRVVDLLMQCAAQDGLNGRADQ